MAAQPAPAQQVAAQPAPAQQVPGQPGAGQRGAGQPGAPRGRRRGPHCLRGPDFRWGPHCPPVLRCRSRRYRPRSAGY
ncbi:hypothetical protein DBZ45_22240 [Arthrobacter globiformis]|uniref:Uncharacterized protein n=1 Tax=Arthrobacter globiformis TaxID=1665 RepID=A0A328H9P3_ARTGO|nr:hypothetical protein DBZ45_22240 [Arthrobacter globiformis]